ncbi:MAG: sulfurtransferase, partial [Microbacterium sp.]
GLPVREMIGGYEYWVREGQPTENDEGPLPRTFDPQVMVVRS